MDRPFPIRLSTDPIVESIFELRFRTESGIAASDLLPGLLFPTLKRNYPRISKLPVSQIPKEIRSTDPSLAYVPSIRFEGDQFAIMIGDAVCSVSCRRPYVGWLAFREKIEELSELIKNSEIVTSIERFSLKYVNLLEATNGVSGLSLLDSLVRLGPYDLAKQGGTIRTEIVENNTVSIVSVVSSAKVVIPGTFGVLEGLLVDIDSISQYPTAMPSDSFWSDFLSQLDTVRAKEKDLFFSLLAQATIDRYGPYYAGKPT